MTEPTSAQELFKGRHFELVQMMAERGITLTHTTILRWAQRYVPEFEKRWSRYERPVGDSWRVDEAYLKSKSEASGSICIAPSISRVEPSTFS